MLSAILPLAALAAMLLLIWYLGGSGFGRAQTQQWIDATGRWPALRAFLDRHHGKFRAAGHYVEFGGLFLVLYWLYDALLARGGFRFEEIPAAAIAGVCAVAALLDELHQLRSGSRQFRRVDFLHSCCGIVLAAAIVQYQTVIRGVL